MGSNENHEQQNRSSAPTPEQLANQNAMISAAVTEAVKQVFASLAPVLKEIALTPEKLRDINKPYKDPAAIARELREMTLWKADEAENRRLEKQRQDNCLHQDERGQSSLRIIRNYADRQPRGICMHCHALITPKEWRIGAPDKDNPRGRAYLAEPHKNYQQVIQIASRE